MLSRFTMWAWHFVVLGMLLGDMIVLSGAGGAQLLLARAACRFPEAVFLSEVSFPRGYQELVKKACDPDATRYIGALLGACTLSFGLVSGVILFFINLPNIANFVRRGRMVAVMHPVSAEQRRRLTYAVAAFYALSLLLFGGSFVARILLIPRAGNATFGACIVDVSVAALVSGYMMSGLVPALFIYCLSRRT